MHDLRHGLSAQHRAQRPDGLRFAEDAIALRSPIVLDAQLLERLLDDPASLSAVQTLPFNQQNGVGDASTQFADRHRRARRPEVVIRKVFPGVRGGKENGLFVHQGARSDRPRRGWT